MIIDHNHPLYKAKWKLLGDNRYNGAYYYSREIVKNIIPNVKTDRNWITIRLPEMTEHPDHSIIFIHNNRNPNYYSYLKEYKDCILVCGLPKTVENMRFYSDKVIYLPLSVDVPAVRRYKVKNKTKEMAFAGRLIKISRAYHAPVPKECDILTGMPQTKLLKEMAKYKKIYATGRTAIQAKILGCEIGVHDPNFPNPNFWSIVDNKEAAKILTKKINEIDYYGIIK